MKHMPVNATHPEYDASLPAWLRARDDIAGEAAVKSAGEKYSPAPRGSNRWGVCRLPGACFVLQCEGANGRWLTGVAVSASAVHQNHRGWTEWG
jgi:hypothetical protein